MKVLIIGGTSFVGPFLVEILAAAGHDVTVFHRGQTNNLRGNQAVEVIGDRKELDRSASDLLAVSPDVVVDMIPHSRDDAEGLLEVYSGTSARIVAVSSGNIYRGFAIFTGEADGPVLPGPLTEESPLRDSPVKGDDKRAVEEALLGQSSLPVTVLRLPMVCGPGDRQHRLFDVLRRIQDVRPAILLEEGFAHAVLPRGYVENVAAAIALAVTDARASGRVYNVADADPVTEIGWVQRICDACDWQGQILAMPMDALPEHLRHNARTDQSIEMDSARIRTELGFCEPVPLDEALRRTIEWELANPPSPLPTVDYEAEDEAIQAV